jgi:hypothetical protein
MFFVYQHRDRVALLEMAQEYFGGGRIRPKPGNEAVLVYSIQSRPLLTLSVVPFLRECMAFSARTDDYGKFIDVMGRFNRDLHRTRHGLAGIVEVAYSMNQAGKQRKQALGPILDRILRGHMPNAPAGSEDMVRPPRRRGELEGTETIQPPSGVLGGNRSA